MPWTTRQMNIEHKNFNLNGEPLRILMGGSPCTFWSIARTKGREVQAEGMGWELFKNYLIAKEKFQPHLFLYENNKSAAKEIKEQIQKELKTSLMYIDSALVSAQKRQRFYVFNWDVAEPEDRGIHLEDILDYDYHHKNLIEEVDFFGVEEQKSSGTKRIGTIGNGGQGERVYSIKGKSVTLSAMGGGRGAKTGLYKVSDTEVRKLSPIESERLQTMPDGYTCVDGISDAQRYKALGNGWTAEVIIHILNGALKDIPKDYPIEVLSMYDGIGTGRYCLEKMGFTNITYKAYEIDKYAIKIATANYPDIVECGDAFVVRNNDWKF